LGWQQSGAPGRCGTRLLPPVGTEVLVDTPGEISALLASDHATTELNLGYLTEPRHDGNAAPHGEGAELRTSEAIALHAMRSILLS
jgi:type VI secretion system secreted protein VgrG